MCCRVLSQEQKSIIRGPPERHGFKLVPIHPLKQPTQLRGQPLALGRSLVFLASLAVPVVLAAEQAPDAKYGQMYTLAHFAAGDVHCVMDTLRQTLLAGKQMDGAMHKNASVAHTLLIVPKADRWQTVVLPPLAADAEAFRRELAPLSSSEYAGAYLCTGTAQL